MKCKICESESCEFSRAKILKKYDIAYFRCANCGFIQTEEPYWIDEAYSDAVYCGDVGLVRRNIMFMYYTKLIITAFFERNGKFLDYGGGYGLFVRLMRDCGFDFYRHDNYCHNIFAKNLDANILGKSKYELITAIEVFEHFINPSRELENILGLSRNILFATQCVPNDYPKPNEWWYYGLMHGQHVSLYTIKSLKLLAKNCGLNFYSNGTDVHLITDKRLPKFLFKLLSNHRIAHIISPFIRRKSYLQKDSDDANIIYS